MSPSLHGVPDMSSWQVLLQQSPFAVLPSSHCSPQAASSTPSPQSEPLPVQTPAPSHRSDTLQTLLSSHGLPATSKRQAESQQSPFAVFPSSHCSPHRAFNTPSPQTVPPPTQVPAPSH